MKDEDGGEEVGDNYSLDSPVTNIYNAKKDSGLLPKLIAGAALIGLGGGAVALAPLALELLRGKSEPAVTNGIDLDTQYDMDFAEPKTKLPPNE